MKRETWYHVVTASECYGFAAINSVITKAALVVSWMIGLDLKNQKLRNYFLTQKTIVSEVK